MNDDELAVFRTYLETKGARYTTLLARHEAEPHSWAVIHELLITYLLA